MNVKHRESPIKEETLDVQQRINKNLNIEDFGSKLGGAKKDKAHSMREAISDDAIASVPLSKSWPKPDLAEIEDNFTAALITAVRDKVPAKPRVASKVNDWAVEVQILRQYADDMIRGNISSYEMKKILAERGILKSISDKINLLMELDRNLWSKVKQAQDFPCVTNMKKASRLHGFVSMIMFHIMGAGKSMRRDKQAEVGSHFSVNNKLYSYKESWKEILNQVRADLGNASVKKMHVRVRDNIRKDEVRNKENKPRTGANHRQGKNITAEMFMDAFGFRGVEFGLWVKQGASANQRQGMLNKAYDSLMDLAEIIAVPSRAVSLNGSLGLAFGSRGSGLASAHFEPDTLIINLTRTRGAGTLAHEWFHAMDNYFQRARGIDPGSRRKGCYITYEPEPLMIHESGRWHLTRAELTRRRNTSQSRRYHQNNWYPDPNHPEGVRPVVEKAFADLIATLNKLPMHNRVKGAGYWARIIERAARSFENYVINEMALKGYDNDYLANVKLWDQWRGKNPERYPYLKPGEIAPVKEAFDELFSILETKETEKGIALY